MEEQLSKEQEYAFHKFKKGYNLFITGPGGVGKSKLIRHFVDYAKENKKCIQVCAMTGCAALLLGCNARTIHSWAGIKLGKGPDDQIISQVIRNNYAKKSWKKVKILVIDEISMMSKKIFNLLDKLAKIMRSNSSPFGGIQIIFTGDFFQLGPIGNSSEPDSGEFCFESKLWNNVFTRENHIELKTMFRQRDPKYIEILSQIRMGELSQENVEILKKYVKREYESNDTIVVTKLYPVKSKTDYINKHMFEIIEEPATKFDIVIRRNCKTYYENDKPIDLDILEKCNSLSKMEIESEIEQLIVNSSCVSELELKRGAMVMCTVNLDMEQGICNGSQGVILDFIGEANVPLVQFSNGIKTTISRNYWQSEEYPIIAIGQYPLCLAWALTIHKIQGATLAKAQMDIGQSIFEYGQTYVALSRIQSLDGLYLSSFSPNRIKANPKVVEFYKTIPDITEEQNQIENQSLDFESYVFREPTIKDSTIKIIKL